MDLIRDLKQEQEVEKQYYIKKMTEGSIDDDNLYKLAMLILKQNDIYQAKTFLREAAERDNLKASYKLAKILEYEFDNSENLIDSRFQYLLRVFRGNHAAFEPTPGAHDLAAAAVKYYFKVINAPTSKTQRDLISKAKYNISNIRTKAIRIGYNDLQDTEELLREAADNGHHKAQFALAMILKGQNGMEKRAREYLKKSSDGNYIEAQYELASLLKQERQGKECEDLYRKAAFQGHPKAKYELALLLEEKIKNEKNSSEVQIYKTQHISFLLSSARDGDIDAQYKMGEYFEKEYRSAFVFYGGELEQAREWYQKAAEQGHKAAKEKLSKLG